MSLFPAYGNFKVDKLLRKRAHLVVEAEAVDPRIIRRKHKVALALLLPRHNHSPIGPHGFIVHVERAAGLDLQSANASENISVQCKWHRDTYSEIEGDLGARLLDVIVEAGLLVGIQLVRESSRRY